MRVNNVILLKIIQFMMIITKTKIIIQLIKFKYNKMSQIIKHIFKN